MLRRTEKEWEEGSNCTSLVEGDRGKVEAMKPVSSEKERVIETKPGSSGELCHRFPLFGRRWPLSSQPGDGNMSVRIVSFFGGSTFAPLLVAGE